MSPKPKPKSPPASKARAGAAKQGTSTSRARSAPARRPPARAAAAAKPRFSKGWAVAGGVAAVVVAIALAAALAGGGGSSGTGGQSVAASADLVRATKAAGVPLLTAEGVATHIHTSLVVMVNGKEKEVPAGIGIDAASGHIAALHTHDTSGLIHLESAKEHDDYTLEQFLTVWGMPSDAAGRCAFLGAASPCTLSVTSKDSGTVGLDVPLKDYDTLTLTVTSS